MKQFTLVISNIDFNGDGSEIKSKVINQDASGRQDLASVISQHITDRKNDDCWIRIEVLPLNS